MWILWPSFLAAGVGTGLAFAFIDPLDVAIFGYPQLSRLTFYTASFFAIWGLGALSSGLTMLLLPNKETMANELVARKTESIR